MLVCICKGVSDRTVKAAISDGADSIRDLAKSCSAGTGEGCGMCHQELRSMLSDNATAERKDGGRDPAAQAR